MPKYFINNKLRNSYGAAHDIPCYVPKRLARGNWRVAYDYAIRNDGVSCGFT